MTSAPNHDLRGACAASAPPWWAGCWWHALVVALVVQLQSYRCADEHLGMRVRKPHGGLELEWSLPYLRLQEKGAIAVLHTLYDAQGSLRVCQGL